MGVFAGPEINENGLIFCIDPANTKSYVGSGTTINNLIGQLSNELSARDSTYKIYDPIVSDFIIPNSQPGDNPVFNSSNFGTITFDGNKNSLLFYSLNLTSVATIELWAKIETNYSNKMLFSFGSYNIWCGDGNLGFNTSNNDVYGISSANISSLGLVNQWKYYVFELRSDVSYTNNKIYINTQSQNLSQQKGSESTSNRNFNNINGRISSWYTGLGYEMPMTFGSIKIYNRALTELEINNSFRLGRSRFGI